MCSETNARVGRSWAHIVANRGLVEGFLSVASVLSSEREAKVGRLSTFRMDVHARGRDRVS